MPLDTAIRKVLVIGSGPLVIGPAAESMTSRHLSRISRSRSARSLQPPASQAASRRASS